MQWQGQCFGTRPCWPVSPALPCFQQPFVSQRSLTHPPLQQTQSHTHVRTAILLFAAVPAKIDFKSLRERANSAPASNVNTGSGSGVVLLSTSEARCVTHLRCTAAPSNPAPLQQQHRCFYSSSTTTTTATLSHLHSHLRAAPHVLCAINPLALALPCLCDCQNTRPDLNHA